MIPILDAAFTQISIHTVGNKLLGEKLTLSTKPTQIVDETLRQLLLQYFLSPFDKTNEVYSLYHPTGDVGLNEMNHFAEKIFANPSTFHEHSAAIASHLYDVGNHPKIKTGELYGCYFDALPIEGQMVAAIGFFKSESKEPYLTIAANQQEYTIGYQQEAINIKKLDKGCLIFNTKTQHGYTVLVIDQTNKTEAAYWIDDFLKLKIINNNFNQTNTVLKLYKNFVQQEMDEEFALDKTDKIDLLNRSIQYFKENEKFNLDSFSHEVINNEQGIASFKEYKTQYEQEYELPIPDSFTIHTEAVKKQARVFKSVLKLDKNFHIYIHGNNELIERGYDEGKKLNYYKVFFRDEV